MNKNITLSVPESTLKAVRRIAVEHDTTVNGVVRGFFTYLSEGGKPVTKAVSHRERLKRLDAIWKIVDREKAKVGQQMTRSLAYED